MKNKIKETLVGLAIIGTLALPQGIDNIVNGPYKVTKIGEGTFKRTIHEYDNKITVTGWSHPWGTILVDENKDGELDDVYIRSLPAKVVLNKKLEPTSKLFQYRQAEYEELMEKYRKY